MSDLIETLLLRNLQKVFRECDPAHRRAVIAELYTEDCTVLLPIGRYIGHQALDQVAGELRAGHPSFVYTPHSVPQAVQNGGRIAWGSGPAGEPPRYTGLDVIIVRDGKIAALYVFLDALSVAIAEERQQAFRIEPWHGCGGRYRPRPTFTYPSDLAIQVQPPAPNHGRL
jgi:hypothetical protein